MKKFYITTPVYYVNDVPHIGHTYTTVAADVLARWHRQLGEETFFLTGTDEHGAKIENKAREMKIEPKQYADEIAGRFKAAWRELNISHDNFLRTTDPAHVKAVQKALQFMYDKGDIYLGKYEGLYCRGCEQYKSERDLVDGLCPDHQAAPEKMSEECYTFRLSKYQDQLLKLIKKDKIKILPLKRKNEVVSFIEQQGLEDVSFSRKNIKWGIPIPWDKAHTIYVWADAFLNYLTGLGWDGPNNPPTLLLKGGEGGLSFWPPTVQLMSKDILRVHATIWQAMLLSLELPAAQTIFVHGYFLTDGQKMSKSLGNVIAPEDLVKKYGVDATRYLIMSAAAFGQDGDISYKKFDEKYNADLANGLGNLAARTANLLEKNNLELKLSGFARSGVARKTGSDKKLVQAYKDSMKNFKLDQALKSLWEKLRRCDEALSEKKPWQIKDLPAGQAGKKAVKKILFPIAQDILNVAYLLKPFMPDTAEKIIAQFSAKRIAKGEPLFPRI